jgi:hypothetical protein
VPKWILIWVIPFFTRQIGFFFDKTRFSGFGVIAHGRPLDYIVLTQNILISCCEKTAIVLQYPSHPRADTEQIHLPKNGECHKG